MVTYSIYLCSVFLLLSTRYFYPFHSSTVILIFSLTFFHFNRTHCSLSLPCTNTVVQGCFSAYILSHIRGQMHSQFLAESRTRDRVRGETKKKEKSSCAWSPYGKLNCQLINSRK